MRNIRAITFDLDDTLWEIHPVIRRAERALHEWLSQHYPRITEKFDPAALREVRANVVSEHPQKSHDLTFLRYTTLAQVASAAGYETDFIDDAFRVFDDVRNDVELFPGVVAALTQLGEQYRIIALTNGNADLKKIGIDGLFDAHITAASAGAAKPSAVIFEAAIQAAGYSAAETLHVGDHPEFDVLGAKAAGMPSVWLNRLGIDWPHAQVAPDIEVAHVEELLISLGVDE